METPEQILGWNLKPQKPGPKSKISKVSPELSPELRGNCVYHVQPVTLKRFGFDQHSSIPSVL